MYYEENENNNQEQNVQGAEQTQSGNTYDASQNDTTQNESGNPYTYGQSAAGQEQSSNPYGHAQNDSAQQSNNTYQQSGYQTNYQSGQNNYYQQNHSGQSNKPPKKSGGKKGLVAAAVVVGVTFLISSIALTVSTVSRTMNKTGSVESLISGKNEKAEVATYEDIGSTSIENTSTTTTSTAGITVTDVSSVVDATMPSVVAITSTTIVENSQSYYEDIFGRYFGYGDSGRGNEGQTYEQQAAGSGIIVDQTDTELLIVTNNHVVEGADSLKIQFNGSDKNIDGYTKGTDADVDIAVVAVKLKDIPSDIMKSIKKATIGDSDNVKVGEGVIAIGNALGYGQSVTSGVISAKDREVSLEDNTMKLLQTDAAINGGNSGGALINAKGEVIGINVAKYSSSGYDTSSIEGMGFAIPITSVKSIIGDLETRETRTKVSEDERGYLGISPYDVTDDVAEQYSMPKGVYISEVIAGGPAEKAGLQESDIITKIDGQSVTSSNALNSLLDYYKAGEKISVTIAYRDGREYKEKDVTVTLGSKDVISKYNSNN